MAFTLSDYRTSYGSPETYNDTNETKIAALKSRLIEIDNEIESIDSRITELQTRVKEMKNYENDPLYQTALSRYIDTGDDSSLVNYRNMEEARKVRLANEEKTRVEKEKNDAERAKLQNVQINQLKLDIDNDAETINANRSSQEVQLAKTDMKKKQAQLADQFGIVYNPTVSVNEQQKDVEGSKSSSGIIDTLKAEKANILTSDFTPKEGENKKVDTWNKKAKEFNAKLQEAGAEAVNTIGLISEKQYVRDEKKYEENKEESKNKELAKQYVGKNVNSLTWKKIPDAVKQYLNRDANGNVKLK